MNQDLLFPQGRIMKATIKLISKAKNDILALQAKPSEANTKVINYIIEAVQKSCGALSANSLIKELKLDKHYQVEQIILN